MSQAMWTSPDTRPRGVEKSEARGSVDYTHFLRPLISPPSFAIASPSHVIHCDGSTNGGKIEEKWRKFYERKRGGDSPPPWMEM